MLFDVRVTAFDPQAAVDPVEALMRLFKIERGFAREVVHRLPRVIKRGVPLETAQRLGQVLERIGAQVEILVSERSQVPAASSDKPNARAERADSATAHGGTQRATVGRGLPPPSAAALAQAPAALSLPTAHASAPQARRSVQYGQQRSEALASLPTPAFSEESAAPRPISAVHEGRGARALREQVAARTSLPDASALDMRQRETRNAEARGPAREQKTDARLAETRSETRPVQPQPFDPELPSANVRAFLKQTAGDDSALAARVSLPMGSWADNTQAEDSRVTAAPARASLPGGAPEPHSTGALALPAGKPSVKEILARRSLSQSGTTQPGVERGSKVPGELSQNPTPNAGRPLALPSFSARGPSLADEVDELPGALEQRRKLSVITWLLLCVASLASAGLFALLMLSRSAARRRRRQAELRELQASALSVGQSQLPELYACVKQLGIRLEISPSPRLYVVERLVGRRVQSYVQRGGLVIMLDAGLLGAAARFDAGYIIQFVLAHEMAAYALGQHGWMRNTLGELWAAVHRSDLLSADALAAKLMADRNEPVRALASLLCGPELAHLVDLNELERQTTSQEQEAKLHGDASEDASYLLPRIQQLRRAAQAK